MELILARLQFAITVGFHFLFVPLTLGLSVLIAVIETLYVKTGKEIYLRLARFWGRIFVLNFAMGIVTGIALEFQFGMNWSEYSRFMGDIFGVPLAFEALTAFFLESTFLGLWIFGWHRMSKPLHAFCMWVVAFAGNLSAVWIMSANAFMQAPTGYVLRNGRAELVDFWAFFTNPYLLRQLPHMLLAGMTTATVFIVSISAWHFLRGHRTEFFRTSMKIGLSLGLIAAFLVIMLGHVQGLYVARDKPMKLAAMEALWETEQPASLSVIALIDETGRKNQFSLEIPYALGLLAFNSPFAEVRGMNDLQKEAEKAYGPGNYIPPVTITYWSFRLMVGIGMVLLLALAFAWWVERKGSLEERPNLLRLLFWLFPLPYIANITGWTVAEVGRQPWIVYGLQKVDKAFSPVVTTGHLIFSLSGYLAIYTFLFIVWVYLMKKTARINPDAEVS
ncbi:MAG TPA: cytochrome ubiquinol oxidase subunit I [Negativicutes bacterium]|nr:cytochrome ubiquinol oxidase subunit I [Negativicutes bacterium]